MKITKLELKGYKRLFLSNIDEMIYEPKNKIQLILGTNSSGKSSTLTQLSPLPANLKKDYVEGGYKLIELTHNGKYYELSSGLLAKSKHSFVVDGVELNQSGTVTVQTELVNQHFSLTNNIHDLLIGNKNFSTMGPTERKSYITHISDIDYVYPMKYFNKLKQRYRDVKGGIKLLYKEIVSLENKAIPEEEYKAIESELKNLTELVELLLSNKSHNQRANKTLEDSEQELSALLRKVEKFKSVEQIEVSELETKRTEVKVLIANTENEIEKLNKVLLKYQDNEKLVETNSDLDIDAVKNKLADLENVKMNLEVRVGYEIDYEYFLKSWEDIRVDFLSAIERLKEIEGVNLTRDNINATEANYERYRDMLVRFKDRISNLESQIAEMRSNNSTEKITCPVCNEAFDHNHDKDIEKLEQDRLGFIERANNVKVNLNEYSKTKKSLDNAKEIYLEINSYFKNYPKLTKLWDKILDNKKVIELTYEHTMGQYHEIDKSYGYIKELVRLQEEIDRTKKVYEQLVMKSKLEEEMKANNIEKLNIEYDDLLSKKRELQNKLKSIESDLVIMNDIKRYKQLLSSKVKEIYKMKDSYLETIRDEYISKTINELKLEQVRLNTILDEHKNYKAILDKNKELLEQENLREKALKILIDEISPDGGMIADSINGFLNKLIEDMNKVISMIWSYDLKILPFDLSNGGEIDYKFRLLVDNKETIEDVSYGSSSLKEVTDLAFKIVFQNYMWGSEYPLYLDEFGRTFDPEHRDRAYNVINNIFANSYSNIFLISHFDSLHGRFVNADINVLSTDNMNMSMMDKYNGSMELVRSV